MSVGIPDVLLQVAVDLSTVVASTERYQRFVEAVRRVVSCDAVVLLRADGGVLVPLAVSGLAPSVLQQRYVAREQPRLEAILRACDFVRFDAHDLRADPYDHLLGDGGGGRVHSCLGVVLRLGEDVVGVLTLDALEPGRCEVVEDRLLRWLSALGAATLRTAGLVEGLEQSVHQRELVAEELVRQAYVQTGGGLIGECAAVQALREEIDLVAASDLPVLVTGETGVGKELVARTIHARSPRARKPLVAVNCAALPVTLAESELFGHVRGAFTGAVQDRPGRFELADGGTLFLDEVGELPLELQPVLLRALQFGEVQRVGGRRETHVDVRVVAATNRDLAQAVREGRFREDLYHRLRVFPLRVPTLRERLADLELLAAFFLDKARARLAVGPLSLSPQAVRCLSSYDWPGNVRELEHVLLRGALKASGGRRDAHTVVDVAHLRLTEGECAAPKKGAPKVEEAPRPQGDGSLWDATDAFMRERIVQAVEAQHGNWAQAAKHLGVDRGNLHRLARRLGLKPVPPTPVSRRAPSA